MAAGGRGALSNFGARSSDTPHGLTSADHRPWTALATAADVHAVGAGDPRLGQEHLRRLDPQTCSACHHACSAAGFHLLGAGVRAADGVPMPVIGALARPASPPPALKRSRGAVVGQLEIQIHAHFRMIALDSLWHCGE